MQSSQFTVLVEHVVVHFFKDVDIVGHVTFVCYVSILGITKPLKFLIPELHSLISTPLNTCTLFSCLNYVCGTMLSMVKYGVHVKKQVVHFLLNFLRFTQSNNRVLSRLMH